jgi:uncharacterized protein YkwD
MQKLILAVLLLSGSVTHAQLIDSLNTAGNCRYMKTEEKEMIYEINRLRSDPRSYLVYIEPMLAGARQTLKKNGKGGKNYSLTYTTETSKGVETKKVDTTWHYMNEEEVKALSTLVNDLKRLKRLSVLQPDSGIYNAALKHAADQDRHQWRLMHTGSDGSAPWDRITKFSPLMTFGNENLAGRYPMGTAREIVIQLLVDSGIPGYGHRYNLLDPQWTHVACIAAGLKEGMYEWIQNFGVKRKMR